MLSERWGAKFYVELSTYLPVNCFSAGTFRRIALNGTSKVLFVSNFLRRTVYSRGLIVNETYPFCEHAPLTHTCSVYLCEAFSVPLFSWACSFDRGADFQRYFVLHAIWQKWSINYNTYVIIRNGKDCNTRDCNVI